GHRPRKNHRRNSARISLSDAGDYFWGGTSCRIIVVRNVLAERQDGRRIEAPVSTIQAPEKSRTANSPLQSCDVFGCGALTRRQAFNNDLPRGRPFANSFKSIKPVTPTQSQ